jgi:splicing factor 3A subunit 3
MASVLERTRALHEDIEKAEQQICDILAQEPKTHRERLCQQHQVAYLLDNIRLRQKELQAKYADEDHSRKEEINGIAGDGPALFSLFYDKLKETKEYHRKFPDIEIAEDPFIIMNPTTLFSGEEGNGRYVDLHFNYDTFLNLGRTKPMIEALRGP